MGIAYPSPFRLQIVYELPDVQLVQFCKPAGLALLLQETLELPQDHVVPDNSLGALPFGSVEELKVFDQSCQFDEILFCHSPPPSLRGRLRHFPSSVAAGSKTRNPVVMSM